MGYYVIPPKRSVHRNEKIIWVHSEELPEIFPIEHQKPISTGMNQEVIDSLMRSE